MIALSVIGAGFVGGSLATVFAERECRVYSFDKAGKKANLSHPSTFKSIPDMIKQVEQDDIFSGVYFVCVPTPMAPTGECDLSIIESVLRELSSIPGKRVAVIKSTVPPGSTERWNKLFGPSLSVIHSPEFLREATALEDMRHQDRIVLGGPVHGRERAKKVFQAAFPEVPIVETTSTTSELVKYLTNTFLCVKVSFANEMYQVCQATGVKYEELISIATLDKRLGTSHWQVPGPMLADDGSGRRLKGYGGSCFVKDINALIHKAKQLGIIPTVLQAAWQKNLEVRPERDWEKLKGRAVSARVVKPGLKIPMTNIQLPALNPEAMIRGMVQRVFGE